MTALPEKFVLQLNEAIGGQFPHVLHEILVVAKRPPVELDAYRRFAEILDQLRKESAREILLARSLIYIKQHIARLRHQKPPAIARDISIAIENFNDAIVTLNELLVERPQIASLTRAVKKLALKYYQVCLDTHMSVVKLEIYHAFTSPWPDSPPEVKVFPPQEPPPTDDVSDQDDDPSEDEPNTSEPPVVSQPVPSVAPVPSVVPKTYRTASNGPLVEPPKGMTMRWYKIQHWHDFFIGRYVVFERGTYRDQACMVVNFNGQNTRCRFSDGQYHCINVDIPLTWN